MVQHKKRKKKLTRRKTAGMEHVLDLIAALPADMFPRKRSDPKPQRRKGL
jgi:hypothetical protein